MNHVRKKRKTIWVNDFKAKGFRTENGLITNGKQYVAGITINDRESIYAAESIGYWIGFTFIVEPEMNVKNMEPIDVYELPIEGAFSDAKLMDPVYELEQDEIGCHVIHETVTLMLQGCKFVHKKTFRTENTDTWLKDRKEAWKRTQENIAQKIRP